MTRTAPTPVSPQLAPPLSPAQLATVAPPPAGPLTKRQLDKIERLIACGIRWTAAAAIALAVGLSGSLPVQAQGSPEFTPLFPKFEVAEESLRELPKSEIAWMKQEADAELRENPEVQEAIDAWKPELAKISQICLRYVDSTTGDFKFPFREPCSRNQEQAIQAEIAVAETFIIQRMRDDLFAISVAQKAAGGGAR